MFDRWRKRFPRFGLLAVLGGTALATLSSTANAASVFHCDRTGQKCIIKIEAGIIGDQVKILDEKARTIAKGRIIKLDSKAPYAVVSVSNVTRMPRKGFPVIVEIDNRSSSLQWAASFSDNH